MSSASKKIINILGVTGSIGQSAVDVILANRDRFDVGVVTAGSNAKALEEAAKKLGARKAVLGQDALEEAAAEPADITLAAISGVAGLQPIMNAVRNSKAVAIANKEPLVAAGRLVMEAAKKSGCTLLPVDSEHNAIFQVFDFERRSSIEKIILTASGGPFRTWSASDIANATRAQALAHPNWSMGEKISIDSATMMNKALEVIEAHYLFDLPPSKIEVLVHPQSVVHSMVEYCDGSVLAQMGASDMRTPIANVLAWPERLKTPGRTLDLSAMKSLDFEKPDLKKFPAIKMAYDALSAGHHAQVALNAANEVAVAAFLNGEISFGGIMECVAYGLENAAPKDLPTIKDVLSFDNHVRSFTRAYIDQGTKQKAVKTS